MENKVDNERIPFAYAQKLVEAGYKQPMNQSKMCYTADGKQVWIGGLLPTDDMYPCPTWGMLKDTKFYDL